MRISWVVFFMILFVSGAWARDCNVFSRLAQANISDPNAFWDDFARLGTDPSPLEIDNLIRRHNIDLDMPVGTGASTSVTVALQTQSMLTVSRQAERAMQTLRSDPATHRKLQELLEVADGGYEQLASHPRVRTGWNLKKLTNRGGEYTARLSDGFRVLLRRNADNSLEVLDMGNHVTH